MKKMVIVLSTIAVIGLMMGFSCITVHAEEYSDYARKWLEKQREQQEKKTGESNLCHVNKVNGFTGNIK